jgi:hypothetical protein
MGRPLREPLKKWSLPSSSSLLKKKISKKNPPDKLFKFYNDILLLVNPSTSLGPKVGKFDQGCP